MLLQTQNQQNRPLALCSLLLLPLLLTCCDCTHLAAAHTRDALALVSANIVVQQAHAAHAYACTCGPPHGHVIHPVEHWMPMHYYLLGWGSKMDVRTLLFLLGLVRRATAPAAPCHPRPASIALYICLWHAGVTHHAHIGNPATCIPSHPIASNPSPPSLPP